MTGKSQIVEVVISQLDWYIINRVRELRKEKGISQSELSVEMGFSEKLIGSVENPTLTAKFNIRHLNLLAISLKCSLWDIVPKEPFASDMVRVKIKRVTRLAKNGTSTGKTDFEILEVRAIKRR